MSITAILTDIEGTTTDIQFVHKVLFPYAREHLSSFIRQHSSEPHVAAELATVRAIIDEAEASLDLVIQTLLSWIDTDQKVTPLKTLQGFIWTVGYQTGDFQGHLYPDAAEALRTWHQAGLSLNVFSSGSIHAQKLLFGHSTAGDLTPLFSHYFDTTTGAKQSASSYETIAQQLGVPPQNVLFLSDVVAELDAAKTAGMHSGLLARNSGSLNTPLPAATSHKCFSNFQEIDLQVFS
ncbi:MAG: acireductone synthase [Gammaproteobacteria bacterium]